jgi:uncharacterized RDD family membrane protein YckC
MAEGTSVQSAAEGEGLVGLLVKRWFGAWVDLLLLAGIVAGPSFVLSQAQFADALPFLAGAAALYFPICEGLWGRSFGKLLTGLRVVDKQGRAPGFGRAIVRTLARLVEVNPVLAGGVPAGLVVFITKRKQRLGDLLAGTYVLPADSIKQIVETDATLAALRAGRGS